MHHIRLGQGPSLLLLHGLGSSHRGWAPLLPLLAPHFTLTVPDLPGFGRTPLPPAPLSNPVLADAVEGFMDAQGLRGFGEGGEFGEDVGEAGISLGREEKGVGGAGARVAEVRSGGGRVDGAGAGEAVGEADDVGQHAAEDVADGGGAGFGLGDLKPVGFEFDGIRERRHFLN